MLGTPLHLRPDHIELARRGAETTNAMRAAYPPWRKVFPATLRAMRRWSPNDPMLRMLPKQRSKLAEALWRAGFQAGAGYKRS